VYRRVRCGYCVPLWLRNGKSIISVCRNAPVFSFVPIPKPSRPLLIAHYFRHAGLFEHTPVYPHMHRVSRRFQHANTVTHFTLCYANLENYHKIQKSRASKVVCRLSEALCTVIIHKKYSWFYYSVSDSLKMNCAWR
jgi:hypothetical protein